MRRQREPGASRRLIRSFGLVLLLPAAAVVWLGLMLLQSDRALQDRQLAERRDSIADAFVSAFEQAISQTERRLTGAATGVGVQPGDDAIVVTVGAHGIEAWPRSNLLYYPDTPTSFAGPDRVFDAGERLEAQSQDYRGALAAFQSLIDAPDRAVRAGALLRVSRNLVKLGEIDAALRTYNVLASLTDVHVAELPADLVARRARAALLYEQRRVAETRREAAALLADLLAGAWKLDQQVWRLYVDQSAKWAGQDVQIPAERLALAEAVTWLWQRQPVTGAAGLEPGGRRPLQIAGADVIVVWRSSDDRLAALVAGPRFQEREWFQPALAQIGARASGTGVSLHLDDRLVWSSVPAGVDSMISRPADATGLPWTLAVADRSSILVTDELSARRRLIIAGLVLVVGVALAGGYLAIRSAGRELAVARVQSDFVAAVSHEFRTPLTSLQQFTYLLASDDEPPPAKRRTFYEAQRRAADRLQRLVESLLDFGRMEAGARQYVFAPIAVAAIVRAVAEEFRRDALPEGFTLDLSVDDGGAVVSADREALARAIWNLLDNAVKYSGDSRTIHLAARRIGRSAAIQVRDHGLGIPRAERRAIFGKFVRGAATTQRGIKGTGIGLAMADHIVRAHGGRIDLESAPGAGSTFTVVLPEMPAQRVG